MPNFQVNTNRQRFRDTFNYLAQQTSIPLPGSVFDQYYEPTVSSGTKANSNFKTSKRLNMNQDFYGTDFVPISKTIDILSSLKGNKKLKKSKSNRGLNEENLRPSSLFLYHPKNNFPEDFTPTLNADQTFKASSNGWLPSQKVNQNTIKRIPFDGKESSLLPGTYSVFPDIAKDR